MADFKTAYNLYIQPAEGGYANVSNDKGGETYAGISRVYNATWKGWTIIDIKKSRYANSLIPNNTMFQDIQFLVDQFYQDKWDKNNFGDIKSQDIANLLFDFYVNSDSIAIKKIQQLVGVTSDGVMGPKTIAAINNANQSSLYSSLKKVREDFYKAIVTRDPTQEKFLKGWMNRLAKFPTFLTDNALPIAGIIGVLLLVGVFWYSNQESTKKKFIPMSEHRSFPRNYFLRYSFIDKKL